MTDPGTPAFDLRRARDSDGPQLIELIERVWVEYPGCVMDVDGEVPELRRIASAHAEWGGDFLVAERLAEQRRIVGCVGWLPAPERGLELRKLYVAASARKSGLGSALCTRVERAARGLDFVELWSDTRFEDAHRLYEGRGYRRGDELRELHDLSGSVEYYYRLSLQGRVIRSRDD
ncbi:MAG: GNAT family N-acetyltransferase [Deltaproteobacteria bacterium]|nr:GNAT family N-acetyltransferase [Deltaproteobacteria bacterium]MBW2413674.1 GNAT family N-acetyltransferase [Deltaproteobacteria bacterium]